MVNSAEHEICPANKPQITKKNKKKKTKKKHANSFLLKIAEHENFSANKYEKYQLFLAFSYSLVEKISSSAEFMKKVLLPQAALRSVKRSRTFCPGILYSINILYCYYS